MADYRTVWDNTVKYQLERWKNGTLPSAFDNGDYMTVVNSWKELAKDVNEKLHDAWNTVQAAHGDKQLNDPIHELRVGVNDPMK